MPKASAKRRCTWVHPGNVLYEKYHDTEWGVPVRQDRKLFEFLILESAQAGLAWETVLKKREAYRKAFADFDPTRVARFTDHRITQLMENVGIIRNRLKIQAAINNARRFLEIQREFGSFVTYSWSFVGNRPIDGQRKSLHDIPVVTPEATRFAQAMKERGFTFFGPTIAYAFMQATGMVNDHTHDCFRYREVKRKSAS